MIANLVVYQLVLIALVWVFLMLSWLWPSEPAAARTATTHARDATTQTLHGAQTLSGSPPSTPLRRLCTGCCVAP